MPPLAGIASACLGNASSFRARACECEREFDFEIRGHKTSSDLTRWRETAVVAGARQPCAADQEIVRAHSASPGAHSPLLGRASRAPVTRDGERAR